MPRLTTAIQVKRMVVNAGRSFRWAAVVWFAWLKATLLANPAVVTGIEGVA